MSASSYEKTSFDWQLQQWSSQLGEGLQWWLSQLFGNLPENTTPALPLWIERIIFWLMVGAGSLFLIWLGLRLWKFLRPYWQQLLQAQLPSTIAAHHPVAPNLSVGDWLQQAQALQQQGNYREACRCLYMALLRRLDDTQIIPQQASRTDGEYLQQLELLYVQSRLPQIHPYRTLIQTHEQLCFGSGEISANSFQNCQQAYQDLQIPTSPPPGSA